MFLADPTSLLQPLDAVCEDVLSRDHDLVVDVESSVVEWKLADDAEFVPKHPFWESIETRSPGSSWSPRLMKWAETVRDDSARVEHGFDEHGRIVMIRRVRSATCLLYGDGHHDIVLTRWIQDSDRWTTHSINAEVPLGYLQRVLTDDDGRATGTLFVSNEGPERTHQYRGTELFRYDGDRVVESFRQSFRLSDELPRWAKDLDPASQADLYKPAGDGIWESWRNRLSYTYSDTGLLVQVDQFNEDDRKTETLYAINPTDTIDSVTALLVPKLTKAIVKAVKSMKLARPVRRVALIYSAEHVHCGLPSGIKLAGAKEEPIDPLDWEAYSHDAEWPLDSPLGEDLETLLQRLMTVVEADPAYAEDFQPRPYREVLWQTCRAVQQKLSRGWFRITSSDFAVFPLDDHGDVDPADDVRQCLPAELANQVISEST